MPSSEPMKIEVYGDYGCPYVHAAALWLRDLKEILGDDLEVTWRFFPLEQINSKLGPEWKIWEQPFDEKNRVQTGLRAALAVRKQDPSKFEDFHIAWLNARHAMQPGVKPPTVQDVVSGLGLDMAQFETDLHDSKLWASVEPDYMKGIEEVGVFGTPTFVFPGGEAAYLKMRPAPPKEEALAVWNDFVETVVERPNITEIKRPRKPE